jgi:hypothetical protein
MRANYDPIPTTRRMKQARVLNVIQDHRHYDFESARDCLWERCAEAKVLNEGEGETEE